jgi:hypothetical protein
VLGRQRGGIPRELRARREPAVREPPCGLEHVGELQPPEALEQRNPAVDAARHGHRAHVAL